MKKNKIDNNLNNKIVIKKLKKEDKLNSSSKHSNTNLNNIKKNIVKKKSVNYAKNKCIRISTKGLSSKLKKENIQKLKKIQFKLNMSVNVQE